MILHEIFLAPMQYAFMQRALLAAVMVGGICAVLSCFLLVKRWALLGDAISHAVLPGVALAYLLNLPFFLGAVVTGMATALGISAVERHSRIKEDSAMGILFTGAFALGFVLVSRIRSRAIDLFHILFGNVLGVSDTDLLLTAATGVVVLGVVVVFYKELVLWTFDPTAASAMGVPVAALHYTLMLLLSVTIVASLQAVGIVLVVAMLITPGATAYLLVDRMSRMIPLAVGVGMISSLSGLYLSYHLNVASGPTMVLVATFLFLLAMLLGPREGVLWNAARRRRAARRVALEDLLKQAYLADRGEGASVDLLARRLGLKPSAVLALARRLAREGLVQLGDGGILLTARGREQAVTLVRSHRLWERYLVDRGGVPWTDVHAEAERLEHLSPRELAAELDRALGRPVRDPHGARIPRDEREPWEPLRRLAERRSGETVDVLEVEDEDPEVLRRLSEKGILPGTRLEVLEVRPEGIRIRVDDQEEVLDLDLAAAVLTAAD
ncbi:MAG: metal ABC transporter permease [Armatimonadota bacterium]|nr:metal ABC transporter permease [Armatimonadota bacterium]MDR7438652.1 metal ABC transporter permease [Armatimonadota bacterium]